jgi:16S rRNA G1207 methylase RsmC
MERLLGNLEVLDRDRGYHLYASRLDESMDAQLAAELIGRSYEIGDTRLAPLVLEARPGVFSRKQLDPGTAELIDHVSQTKHDPARVIDLCAGIGPLALWAARRYERARVMAIDSNYLAVELLERNANKAGLDARVEAVVSDGLLGLDVSRRAGWAENADLVLINPPTHAEPDGLRQLLGGVAGFLAPQGVALAVVNRPGRASEAFAAAGLVVNTIRHGAYWIVEARRPSAQ